MFLEDYIRNNLKQEAQVVTFNPVPTLFHQPLKDPVMKKLTLIAAASAALLTPMLSHAESAVNTAAVVGSVVSAKLNFTVVIPSVLYLAVGQNTAFAANAGVDSLVFTVPATNIGDSTVIAGVGGDQAAGAVTVRVFSNVGGATGNVNLNSTTSGQLTNGTDRKSTRLNSSHSRRSRMPSSA